MEKRDITKLLKKCPVAFPAMYRQRLFVKLNISGRIEEGQSG
jgi:hypothetical protein